MKKIFVFIISVVAFLPFITITSRAMTLSPANGTIPLTGNKVISVLATTPSSAFQMRLVVDNAKVVSYSPPTGAVIAIGVCDSEGGFYRSVSATKYELCVDLASTNSTFASGASLGTITVANLGSTGGSFTITGGPDNKYPSREGDPVVVSGVLGNYTFGNSTGGMLPNTALTDHMPSKGLLGVAILTSGIVSLAVAIKIFLIDKRQGVF